LASSPEVVYPAPGEQLSSQGVLEWSDNGKEVVPDLAGGFIDRSHNQSVPYAQFRPHNILQNFWRPSVDELGDCQLFEADYEMELTEEEIANEFRQVPFWWEPFLER
jgi:hypothetical protein